MTSLIKREYLFIGSAFISGAVVLYYATKSIRKLIKNHYYPYIKVGTVAELYIYPVESARGRQVKFMECDEIGGISGELKDRRFFVLNKINKTFVTAEIFSRMVLIDSDIRNGVLTLSTPETEPITLDLAKVLEYNKTVTGRCMKDEKIQQEGLECGYEIGRWLSKVLRTEEPLSLLYCKDGFPSSNCQCFIKNLFTSNYPLISEQTYIPLEPYMILSSETINKLNDRFDLVVDQQITSRHFRPNIVVDNCSAFDEDNWLEIKIGQAEFQCKAPCKRTYIMMIDPSTGEQELGEEYIDILRDYHNNDANDEFKTMNEATLGTELRLTRKGQIKTGDTVYARYKQ